MRYQRSANINPIKLRIIMPQAIQKTRILLIERRTASNTQRYARRQLHVNRLLGHGSRSSSIGLEPLTDRCAGDLLAISELRLVERLKTVVTVTAALIRKSLVEIIVHNLPAASGTLAVQHHALELFVVLDIAFDTVLYDQIDFAATK